MEKQNKEKCEQCVWCNKIHDNLYYCMLPKCVKGVFDSGKRKEKEDWKATNIQNR